MNEAALELTQGDAQPVSTKLHPFMKEALKYRAKGHSIQAIAAKLNVSRSQVTAWRSNHAFAQAWLDAEEGRGDWWEDRLRKHAMKDGGGAVTATIVGLKMAGRFQDSPQISVTQVNQTADLSSYTPEQLDAMLAKLESANPPALNEPTAP